MPGTRITDLKLIKVVDGDTVKVELNGVQESLRLLALDTEESQRGGGKPVTNAGIAASQWAKDYFMANAEGLLDQDVRVDIEFDTDDPVEVCLQKHRGNYGRLLCYVHKDGDNYNLRAVDAGWSPYFVKYGRSRLYHREFLRAEHAAQADGVGVWDPLINVGGERRDYPALVPWWQMRDAIVQDYRQSGAAAGALSVRLDYELIRQAADHGRVLTVLCDLQGGINKWPGNGALIFAGSPQHKFNLWIPERDSPTAQQILRLLETRYTGQGRGYVYVNGPVTRFPPADGNPQIVLDDVGQLRDLPPG